MRREKVPRAFFRTEKCARQNIPRVLLIPIVLNITIIPHKRPPREYAAAVCGACFAAICLMEAAFGARKTGDVHKTGALRGARGKRATCGAGRRRGQAARRKSARVKIAASGVAAAGRKTRAGVKRLLFGAFRVKMACNIYNN